MTRGPLVVIGSGLAGLSCARAAGPHECVLLTAGTLTEGAASMWAQGGIAAAIGPNDAPALHAQDTWLAGARHGDRQVIDRITAAAPAVVRELSAQGVCFDRRADGAFDLALEGGHRLPRILHSGDRSGAAITSAVAAAVLGSPWVEVREHAQVSEVLTDAAGCVRGVDYLDAEGNSRTIRTDRVVLATGGMGGLWSHTTNPTTARGQGVALAARIGARTDDLHLVQFHPTGLDVPRDPMPLLTEALRGAGAVLRADGRRFTDELQPRDVVAAAVWTQLTGGHRVYLDAREIADVADRFPAVAELTAASGLDLATDLLPVRPALHYSMGGVTVDERSRTSVPGLWAIGETSRTGLHGANRLASNSLLEAVVTATAAAHDATRHAPGPGLVAPADPATIRPRTSLESCPLSFVRQTMDQACGVLRDGVSLERATAALEDSTGDDVGYAAWLVTRSASAHPNSIGAHRRTDSVAAQEVYA